MDDKLSAAFDAIIEGACTHHMGLFLDRQQMQIDGINKTDEGMKIIDEEVPEKRDVLIPLLSHENLAVRVTVATALLVSRPTLALPVLENIAQNCSTMPQASAQSALTFYKVFGPGVMSLCRPDPRFPIPEEHRFREPPEQPAS